MTVSVTDAKLVAALEAGLPLVERPFAAVGDQIGMVETEVIGRTQALQEARIVGPIAGVFDARRLGHRSTLLALRVSPDREEQAAGVVGGHPGVSHVYRRSHAYGLWVTLVVPPTSRLGLERTAEVLGRDADAESTLLLPALKIYKLAGAPPPPADPEPPAEVIPEEVAVIRELQRPLPVVPAPFADAAVRLGLPQEALFAVARRLLESGRLRRVGALVTPGSGAPGATTMGVWAVPEERIDEVAAAMSADPAVSHCYRRPVHGDWPYSLFTVVQGDSPADCEAALDRLSRATGITEYRGLPATREFQRTRPVYFPPDLEPWEDGALAREQAAGRA